MADRQDLEPGTLVVCSYRHPSILQPWIHEVYVGVIETPGTDKDEWNGYNSEAYYCQECNKARVRYSWGVMHDNIDFLSVITPEEAALSFREKIARFLGEEALSNFDRSMMEKHERTRPYHDR